MGFVAEVLDSVNGIQWFYIIGILIFVSLFVLILFRTLRIPREDIDEYKSSILDQDESKEE